MAMDLTDRRLVNGVILFLIILLVAYFLPYYGYQVQQAHEEDERTKLQTAAKGFERFFPPLHPTNWGVHSTETVNPIHGTPLATSQSKFKDRNLEIIEKIKIKEGDSRMLFADWTNIPPDRRQAGVYFEEKYEEKREVLKHKWEQAGVECLDEEIGFAGLTGLIVDENKSKEYLRKLFVAEKIITLCMDAKLQEEQSEKKRGLVPEAYMQIRSVMPQPSITAGPSALVPNPQYDPNEKNPSSRKFGKYKVKSWDHFIQEYPIEIVLQCDVNTFERFLHSVRTPGQFLVIRNLEIVSPYMEESMADKTEMNIFSQSEKDEKTDKAKPGKAEVSDSKHMMLNDIVKEHIIVRMSAAGMDFYDPKVLKYGYHQIAPETHATTTVRHRAAGVRTQAQ